MVRHIWVTGGLIGVMVLTACGQTPNQPTPTASIRLLAPISGTPVLVGAPLDIRGEYSGDGIVQVRVNVNGVEHATLPAAAGAPAFSAQWVAQAVGQTVIFLEALDADKNVLARSDVVAVLVSAPTPAVEPTQPPPPLLPTPTVAAPTVAATTTAIAATGGATATIPAELAVALAPSLTVASDFANLRAGPGTAYDLAGRLNQGQTAAVTGKSADGQWWQVSVDGKTVWIFGQLVQGNAAANEVAVAQAPALPTAAPTTAVAAAPTATPQAVALAPTATPAPTAVSAPADPVCNAENPFWAAKLNNNLDYTFCTPVPFEFVFNASPDPDEMVIRWHIYGDIRSLELRLDPSSDSCGQGSTGFRQQVPFKEENFRLNRRGFPPGGYKLGLWATMGDGRVQDWGELHFCGK